MYVEDCRGASRSSGECRPHGNGPVPGGAGPPFPKLVKSEARVVAALPRGIVNYTMAQANVCLWVVSGASAFGAAVTIPLRLLIGGKRLLAERAGAGCSWVEADFCRP